MHQAFPKKHQSQIGDRFQSLRNDLNDRCYATCFVDLKVGVSKFERHREFSRIIHSKGSSLLIISYTTLLTLTNEKTSTKHITSRSKEDVQNQIKIPTCTFFFIASTNSRKSSHITIFTSFMVNHTIL